MKTTGPEISSRAPRFAGPEASPSSRNLAQAALPQRPPAEGRPRSLEPRGSLPGSAFRVEPAYAVTPPEGSPSQLDDAGPDPDPAVTAAIRAHLEELDASINETQKNLALNPGNDRVQAAAWSAYMAKVDYLRSILGKGTSRSRDRSSGTAAPALQSPA